MTSAGSDDDAAAAAATTKTIQLYCQIATRQGERKSLLLPKVGSTVDMLLGQVSTTTGIPLSKLKVIYRGRIIKSPDGSNNSSNSSSNNDSKSVVDEYRLENDAVLHCMGPVEVDVEAAQEEVVPTKSQAKQQQSSQSAVVAPAPALPVPVAAAAAAAATSVAPVGVDDDPLTVALSKLRQNNTPSVYKLAVETLYKVLSNITDKPHEEKYRKLKRSNPAFVKRLGGVTGGHDAMLAVGFHVQKITTTTGEGTGGDGNQDGDEYYCLDASAEQWNHVIACKAQVQRAIDQVRQNQSVPVAAGTATGHAIGGLGTAATAAAGRGTSGIGGGLGPGGMMNNMGLGGIGTGMNMNMNVMNDPAAQNAMLEMMSNPDTLRAALQNPMVQQMLQNDPSVPPQMRQHMQMLQSNPQMLDMMARSMQDPYVRQQMQQAMSMRGATAAAATGGVPPSTAAAASSTSSSTATQRSGNGTNSGGGSAAGRGDQDQTEEEMIAEAIRRSLEES